MSSKVRVVMPSGYVFLYTISLNSLRDEHMPFRMIMFTERDLCEIKLSLETCLSVAVLDQLWLWTFLLTPSLIVMHITKS